MARKKAAKQLTLAQKRREWKSVNELEKAHIEALRRIRKHKGHLKAHFYSS